MGFAPSINAQSKPIYVAGVESSIEYSDSQFVRKKSPKIRLLLNPFIPPLLPMEFLSQDLGGIIISCSVQKSRNQAHGSFSLTLVADEDSLGTIADLYPLSAIWGSSGKSMKDLFKPMALGQLWMDGYHVMTGVVRVCRKHTKAGSRTYSVQFDELGVLYTQKIMTKPSVIQGISSHVISNADKAIGGVFYSGEPMIDTIKRYFDAFSASSLTYDLSNPLNYLSGSDLLPLAFRLINAVAPLGAISNSSILNSLPSSVNILASGGTSFWDYLKSQVPDTFVEMFCETGGRTICTGKAITGGLNITPMLPGFNYLVIRTNPYDNPLHGVTGWYPLLYPYTMGVMDLILTGDFIIVTDDDVIEKDLGVSDIQQYTSFSVSYLSGGADGTKDAQVTRPSYSKGPILPIYPGGMRTYGAREMNATIEASSSKLGLALESIEPLNQTTGPTGAYPLSTLLNTWFRNASKFNEGTIITRGMPYARPGMVLLYLPSLRNGIVDDPRDIGVYYIDNHTYDYNMGKADTSTFSVTRGTPLPFDLNNLFSLLLDWEVLPPGLNLFDGGN